jgi:DNA-binding XRE family transcriptional regulator
MKPSPHQKFMKEAAALRDKMHKMRETMKDADIARKLGITRQAVNSALGPKGKRNEENKK